jgi:hypothetical protein
MGGDREAALAWTGAARTPAVPIAVAAVAAIAVPGPVAVPVAVGTTLAASPSSARTPTLKRSGIPYVTHAALNEKATGGLRHLRRLHGLLRLTGSFPTSDAVVV